MKTKVLDWALATDPSGAELLTAWEAGVFGPGERAGLILGADIVSLALPCTPTISCSHPGPFDTALRPRPRPPPRPHPRLPPPPPPPTLEQPAPDRLPRRHAPQPRHLRHLPRGLPSVPLIHAFSWRLTSGSTPSAADLVFGCVRAAQGRQGWWWRRCRCCRAGGTGSWDVRGGRARGR